MKSPEIIVKTYQKSTVAVSDKFLTSRRFPAIKQIIPIGANLEKGTVT